MIIRGAGTIGATAAYGLAQAIREGADVRRRTAVAVHAADGGGFETRAGRVFQSRM